MKDYYKFFEDNGYVVVEDVINSEDCDMISDEAERLCNGRYVNMLDLHRNSEIVFNAMVSHKLLDLADSVQMAKMVPIGSIFLFCKPNNPLENGSNFHQDNYAAKAPYGSYLAVGLALDDADSGNGALIVYPGSHKLRDLRSVPSKNFELDEIGKIIKAYPIGDTVEVPSFLNSIQLEYKKGTLIFIHSHLIHGCPKNTSDRWRRKIYMHYIKDGDPFWPGWNARRQIIDRNSDFLNINKI